MPGHCSDDPMAPPDPLTSTQDPVDMLFIDTFHVYGQLRRELARHHGSVSRYIVLHDTEVDKDPGEAVRRWVGGRVGGSRACTQHPSLGQAVGERGGCWGSTAAPVLAASAPPVPPPPPRLLSAPLASRNQLRLH